MNDEMKKILSRFFLVSVLIACVTFFGAGTLTAKQRSEYKSARTEYALLNLSSQGSTLNLRVDERVYGLDLSPLRVDEKYRKWLYLTPFSTLLFFGECIYEFFSA